MAAPKGPKPSPIVVPPGPVIALTTEPGFGLGLPGNMEVTPPSVLVEAAPRPFKLAVAAEGALVNWHYGEVLAQPKIFAIGAAASYIYLGLLWGRGECGANATIYVDKLAYPGGAVHHYSGTMGQTVDSWLAAVIPGYTDALPGYCYSVVTIPTPDHFPVILGKIEGLKVYDPRTTTTVFSKNPALAFREAAIYGGLAVDDISITATADACDELVDGKKRREAGVTFDRTLSLDTILDTLATYAGGFYVRTGSTARLIPNRPASSVLGFTDDEADGTKLKILQDTLKIRKISNVSLPNRVICEYSDTSKVPWTIQRAVAPTSGPAGQVRTTKLALPGIQTFARAKREAIERLNHYTLTDLEVSFVAFDDALKLLVGDVFTVTHADGLVAKPFRATSVAMGNELGHWAITGKEYDPAEYSDAIATDPTIPDTTLPDPNDIPAGPTPTMTEVLFQDETGHTFSRYEVTWAGSTWVYASGYRVKVSAGSAVILESSINHKGEVPHTVATAPVSQGVLYTAEIFLINPFGLAGSTAGTDTDTAQGKLLKPTAPTNLDGFEAGQFVSLTWAKGIDLDYIGTIIKRLPQADYEADVAGAWENNNTVTVQSRIDAEAALLFAQPVGAFYYMVKSLDSLGQESYSASPPYGRASKLINVTADSAGGVSLQTLNYNAGSMVNMFAYEVHGDGTYLVTSAHKTWINLFGTAGSNWTLNFSAGHKWNKLENAVSSVESAEWDITLDKQGNWVWVLNAAATQGSLTFTTRLAKAADYPTFTDFSGQSVNAEGRYFKAKVACSGALGDGMLLKMQFNATFQGRILEDLQTISVPASPQPKAVVWGQPFAAQPRITLTLKGTAPRIISFDSPTKTGCNLYAWDGASPAAATIEVSAIGT